MSALEAIAVGLLVGLVQALSYVQGVHEGRRRAESDAWWRTHGEPTMHEYNRRVARPEPTTEETP